MASEVRKLAERSQIASEEITSLSEATMQTATAAGAIIDKIVPDIRKTADLIQEISSASREQSAGADQIGKALSQLDTVIQQNASASEELAGMAEELSGQSEQLSEAIAYFKVDGTVVATVAAVPQGPRPSRAAVKVAHAKAAGNEAAKPLLSPASRKTSIALPGGRSVEAQSDGDFEEF